MLHIPSFNYYRSLSITIGLTFYFHYHYHYRSKSHYRTCLPIEPRMLDIQVKSYGAKNMEEAMLLEVKSYLKCEMKVKPTELEKLDIVRIFPPAKESWYTLYAEFRKEY